MADEKTPPEDETTPDATEEQPAAEETPAAEAPAEETPAAEADAPAEEDAPAPAAEADEPAAEPAEAPAAEADEPAAEPAEPAEAPAAEADAPAADASSDDESDEAETPRVKPAIPGMDLEVDIVGEGEDPLGRGAYGDEDDLHAAADEQLAAGDDSDSAADQPNVSTIDLAADARYTATGKRKTAIARVIIKPGTGAYTINGKTLDEYFPRPTLQRNIRLPLETVGYEDRLDVVARMDGGGVSAQAGALRHGISRALTFYEPELRPILKKAGFLTRDPRVVERKKYGRAKARRSFQFSKR